MVKNKPHRVLVIGADGADPAITEQLMAAGQLPNLTRLRARGLFSPLITTFPPVSPVAWTSFLTGVGPVRHGLRDFVSKAPGAYRPTLGMFSVTAGEHGLPEYHSRRQSPTLGQILTAAGRRSFTLRVPGDFPPSMVNGGVLAGLGMPDIAGSFGTSAFYTTEQSRVKGQIKLLRREANGGLRGELEGPVHTTAPLYLPPVSQGGLEVGQWTGWLPATFSLPDGASVEGIYRLKLLRRDGETVELYRTSIQCAPHAPLYPLTSPPDLAPRLAGALGPFATLGQPADQSGLQNGLISAETFLESAYQAWDEQAILTRHLLAGEEWDLFIAHYFAIDVAQHAFWRAMDSAHPAHDPDQAARFGHEIARAYRWVDQQVGDLVQLAGDAVTVIVLSDHGGTPINRWFYLNSWLREHGYLYEHKGRVDWSRTRACGFGTGGIFLNLRDREARGIVAPGDEYNALRDELAARLLSFTDQESGGRVVKAVLRGQEVYPGARPGEVPDLLLALHPGFGLGRGEALGRVQDKPAVECNRSWWSGGHEGPYLPQDIPGILLMAGPGLLPGSQFDNPRIIDIAPAILHLLGVDVPPQMKGRPLISAQVGQIFSV